MLKKINSCLRDMLHPSMELDKLPCWLFSRNGNVNVKLFHMRLRRPVVHPSPTHFKMPELA